MTFPVYPLYNKFNTKPLLFIYIYKGPLFIYRQFKKPKIWLDQNTIQGFYYNIISRNISTQP